MSGGPSALRNAVTLRAHSLEGLFMTTTAIGIVGLGRMGGGLAHLALSKGLRVLGLSIGGVPGELATAGVSDASNVEGFRQLPRPRVVMLYIPAGPAVDEMIEQLSQVLEDGDVIVDGGNSYWGDSIRRHDRLKAKGIALVDAGTSGGVSGARDGACFMIGGDDAAVAIVGPILEALAVPGGYVHAGAAGRTYPVGIICYLSSTQISSRHHIQHRQNASTIFQPRGTSPIN